MKLRSFVYTTALVLLTIFIVQNIAFAQISFLVWEFELPRAIIFFTIFVLGFLTGLVTRWRD
ncbi:MAG: hypothetical protein OEU50_08715 [Gammaproteobacteria bacterium]|jgi:uncharacterized integral membrane protein|nr:hypothetical protein [Gammaproteobacteria bacterium]